MRKLYLLYRLRYPDDLTALESCTVRWWIKIPTEMKRRNPRWGSERRKFVLCTDAVTNELKLRAALVRGGKSRMEIDLLETGEAPTFRADLLVPLLFLTNNVGLLQNPTAKLYIGNNNNAIACLIRVVPPLG